MKKFRITTMLAVVAVLGICVNPANAQDKFLTLGVKAGANLSTFSGDINKTKNVFKYQAGITADLAFTHNFYVVTGLDFQAKGTKSEPNGQPNVKFNPMYLQLPVHAAYKFDIAPNTRLVVQAGPYVAYGVGGKMKSDGHKRNVFGDDRFKRFDFGLGAGVGVEYYKLSLKAGYDFGLIDICDVSGVKARNMNGYLTLGYRF